MCGVAARFPMMAYAQTADEESVDCKACLSIDPATLPRPVKIRVYPEKGTLYALVNLWPTKAAMYRHRPMERDHEGSATGIDAWTWTRKKAQFAEVNLHEGSLDAETVAHEFLHATWAWARRVGWTPPEEEEARVFANDAEERFCYAHGTMVQQFVNRAHRRGVYDPRWNVQDQGGDSCQRT